jgi:hypothetical protein
MKNQELMKLFYAELDSMTPEMLKVELEKFEENIADNLWISESFAYTLLKSKFNFDACNNYTISNFSFEKHHLLKGRCDRFFTQFNQFILGSLDPALINLNIWSTGIINIEDKPEAKTLSLDEIKKSFYSPIEKDIKEKAKHSSHDLFAHIFESKDLTNRYSIAS